MDSRRNYALIKNGVSFTDDIPIGMKAHGWTAEDFVEISTNYYFGGPIYLLVPPEQTKKPTLKRRVSRFFSKIFKKREHGYEPLNTVKYDYILNM